jgi:pimeloyl-ACP methyl ester carboxylesterase
MVHGLGGSATNWTDVMGLLQDRFDTIAPDLPGFGWSPPPPRHDYSLKAHARVLTELLEAQDGPVHLLGNSLGGTVCTIVTATRPDLVRTLTLVSPALPVLRPRASNIHLPALAVPFAGQQLMKRLDRYPVEQRVRATIALCFADPSRVPGVRFTEAMTEAERRAHLGHESAAMLGSLRSLLTAYLRPLTYPLWRLAGRVEVPTLLVYGMRDRLVDPRTAYRAIRTFPNARLVTLPDSGHVSQMEHPEVVAREVRRHVDAAVSAGA